jgi:hypothetical protein
MKLLNFLAIGLAAITSISPLAAVAEMPIQKIVTTRGTQPLLNINVSGTDETVIDYGSAGEEIYSVELSENGTIGLSAYGCLTQSSLTCPGTATFLNVKLRSQSSKTIGMAVITRNRTKHPKLYLYTLTPRYQEGISYIQYTPIQAVVSTINLPNKSVPTTEKYLN